MAVVFRKENENEWLILWRITEDAAELARLATSEEIAQAKRIRNDARRREWLAWRAALRSMIPDARVGYQKTGAPVLIAGPAGSMQTTGSVKPAGSGKSETTGSALHDHPGYIGVSHSGDLAAVIYSRHAPCAVDMERLGRDFRRAEVRYLSDAERRLPGYRSDWFPALVWCAKETLYKHAGEEGVDFRDEIRIITIDRDVDTADPGRVSGRLTGRLRRNGTVSLAFFTFENHLVVHTVPPKNP